ncbi:MAG: hypothetical protein C6I00_01045 [Nitratiruptor sp.]|nr:hypothetical protein [Nitratiruptor sp.]NPA83183.1 hypothetical protein [Campylobacterota bacterium]
MGKVLLLVGFLWIVWGGEVGGLVAQGTGAIQNFVELPIPQELLQETRALAIIPNLSPSSSTSPGLLFFKSPYGGWSNPLILRFHLPSFQWHVDVAPVDLLLLFPQPGLLQRLMEGKLLFGIDIPLFAGPLLRLHSVSHGVYSYATGRGVLVPLILAGGSLELDQEQNELLYHGSIEPFDLFERQLHLPHLQELRSWLDRLDSKN